MQRFGNDSYALAFARIECHYFVNRGFFRSDNQLIEDAHRIAHIPGVIIQGRYDVVTPMKNAWDLAKAWPSAELHIVPDFGHAMTEPGIMHEIVSTTNRYAGLPKSPGFTRAAPPPPCAAALPRAARGTARR